MIQIVVGLEGFFLAPLLAIIFQLMTIWLVSLHAHCPQGGMLGKESKLLEGIVARKTAQKV